MFFRCFNRFQHTAARRRLVNLIASGHPGSLVSTHSRPKAAGSPSLLMQKLILFQHTAARRRLGHRRDSARRRDRFNTQPPEGGWAIGAIPRVGVTFQHTAARRRLGVTENFVMFGDLFQHTAARRRLAAIGAIPRVGVTVSTHSRPKAAGHR